MSQYGEDCYFYYYSTCKKANACPYRHCDAAKGSEIVCANWEQRGKCPKMNCAFRHAVIDKSRSAIDCYWEKQPEGCQKPHCVFKHSKPRPKPQSDATSGKGDGLIIHSSDKRSGDHEQISAQEAGDKTNIVPGKRPGLAAAADVIDSAYVSDSEVILNKKRTARSSLTTTDQIQPAGKTGKTGQTTPPASDIPKALSTISSAPSSGGGRKIRLRKPISAGDGSKVGNKIDDEVAAVDREEPATKRRRVWRRKSASPNVPPTSGSVSPDLLPDSTADQQIGEQSVEDLLATAQTTDQTEIIGTVVTTTKEELVVTTASAGGDKQSDSKRTQLAAAKEEEETEEEEYKRKLIDIFGPNLAGIYLSQGIKLDLSQYPCSK